MLEIMRAMDDAKRTFQRDHGDTPAALIIGSTDVPQLTGVLMSTRVKTDPSQATLAMKFAGVPVFKHYGASGCMAVTDLMLKLMQRHGDIAPLTEIKASPRTDPLYGQHNAYRQQDEYFCPRCRKRWLVSENAPDQCS